MCMVCKRTFISSSVRNAVILVRQKRHGVRAADSSSFKDNRCERLLCIGSEVTNVQLLIEREAMWLHNIVCNTFIIIF